MDDHSAPSLDDDPSRRTRRTAIVIGGGAIFLLAVLGAAAVALSPSDDDPQVSAADLLKQTQQVCDASAKGTRIEADGATLMVDSAGNKDVSGLSLTALECVLDEARVPESVKQDMFATSVKDGRQDGAWPGFTASWTYDPDQGLDLTISRTA